MSAPIIPWLGGKRRLADRLIPLFPTHECYVELFCGGAALYFLRPVPAKVEILNDVNGELINLYRVVQHHLEEFVRQFKWALSSREIFRWQQITPTEALTDIQRAARFFYLQHHAFGGKVAGQSFGTATTATPINLCRIEESLSAAHLRLTGTVIENLPWQECLSRYDRAHTFFYADPPYWQVEGYGVPFDFEQYERLADAMRSAKGRVMVSINDHPDIRRAFEGQHFHELKIRYAIANNYGTPQESSELVITNFDASKSGGLF
ncbi:MAG: DNA adenine methylase [Burkholderiales bacterium]|nr:DNA adenine methylase [Burkholderiales bacterium]